jgi:hypothetical protein
MERTVNSDLLSAMRAIQRGALASRLARRLGAAMLLLMVAPFHSKRALPRPVFVHATKHRRKLIATGYPR